MTNPNVWVVVFVKIKNNWLGAVLSLECLMSPISLFLSGKLGTVSGEITATRQAQRTVKHVFVGVSAGVGTIFKVLACVRWMSAYSRDCKKVCDKV